MTFEDVLLEAIEEGLYCLGEQAKQSFYSYLRNKYALSKPDIPYRIEDFTEALEDIFQDGAVLLEIKIMKILFATVGYGYVHLEKHKSLEFTNYIYALRNSCSCSVLPSTSCQPQGKCTL